MKHDNDNKPLSFISMFSGIEAASVAFGPLGWKAICFAEIEKFPSAVLSHHYPDVPNVGDMAKHDWSQYAGKVDIVCGGPPCQAFSIAGLRNSLGDDRGNLSLTYMRAIHAIKPRNAIVENVPGWLSTKDNAFGCFLAGLVGADDPLQPPDGQKWPNAGMVAGPRARAAWRVLDAQYFGLAQRRRRVIVVADFGNGADPAAVLFERKSLSGNTPPSREAGKNIAPTISARPTGGGGLGTDFDLDGGLISSTGTVAHCLNAGGMGRQDYETETMVAHPLLAKGNSSHDHTLDTYVAHSLLGEGFDASEDGTGRGTPIVPVHAIQAGALRQNPASGPDGVGIQEDIAYTLEARAEVQAVAFDCKASGQSGFGVGEIASTLRAMGHKGSHSNGGGHQAVAIGAFKGGQGSAAGGIGFDEHVSPTLSAAESGSNRTPTLLQGWAVRRLTPTECERLQGFPDGYTNIPWRNKQTSPDGPRYKALGNSWAVPKFRWIGERIARLMPMSPSNDNYCNGFERLCA